ncbi:pilus assembly protein [Eubacterium xylanophilum]|uniref:pilus assembly protein n=1 Tax=Eubacterium xylanophilum TaxID=39497 RepID=UPI00047B5977|nr:pilus assembly protein [Eubacterium xylanophilum]
MRIRWNEGSITVEAALIVPILVFSLCSIVYFNVMLTRNECVQWALTKTGREMSIEYALKEDKKNQSQLIFQLLFNKYYYDSFRMTKALFSNYDDETGVLDLEVRDSMRIPFPLYNNKVFVYSNKIRTRSFIGVKTRQNEEDSSEMVYVTKTGRVFHRDLGCSYITPKLSEISFADLSFVRSIGGAKYYPCEACCKSRALASKDHIFICNYGNRYHCARGCSKISRSIERIKLSDVGDRIPCSKCGNR